MEGTAGGWERRRGSWEGSSPAEPEVAMQVAKAAPRWGPQAGLSPRRTQSRRLAPWRGAGAADPARRGPARRPPRRGPWAPAPRRGAPPAVHSLPRLGAQLPPSPLPAAVAKSGG